MTRFRDFTYRTLSSILITTVAAGCVVLPQSRIDPRLDSGEKRNVETAYVEDDFWEQNIEKKLIKETDLYLREEIQFPSYTNLDEVGNHNIEFFYTSFKKKGFRPTVVVTPIKQGISDVEKAFQWYFTNSDYNVVLIDRNKGYLDLLLDDDKKDTKLLDLLDKGFPYFMEGIDTFFEQDLIDSMQILDYVEKENEKQFNDGPIYVFGASLGSFTGLNMLAYDDRVSAASIALSGEDISDIIVNTDETEIRRAVNLFVKNGVTRKDLYESTKNHLEFDSSETAKHIDPNNIILFLAKHDKTVPFENGKALRKALGKPETVIYMTAKHKSPLTLLHALPKTRGFFKKKTREFLERN